MSFIWDELQYFHQFIVFWSIITNTKDNGDPGATSLDNAIFSGESLLQDLKSPLGLIHKELVPEAVEFRPAYWAEKYIFFLPN